MVSHTMDWLQEAPENVISTRKSDDSIEGCHDAHSGRSPAVRSLEAQQDAFSVPWIAALDLDSLYCAVEG